MNVSQDIRDAILLRMHYVARFENTLATELIKTLNQAHADIVSKIAATGGEWTKGWLTTMLADLKKTYGEAFGTMNEDMSASLEKLAGLETRWSAKMLDENIPLGVTITQPSPDQVWAAVKSSPADRGHILSELMDNFEASTVDKLTAAIRQGVVEGETSAQMVQRIRGTRAGSFQDGILQSTRYAAQAIASTAVMHVSNIARNQTYGENSDLFDGVQWVATLDTSTCPVCGDLDGKTWDKAEDAPQPPIHFNCRCVTVPIVKSWKDLGFDFEEVAAGTRASMDGQVPETQTYSSWLRDQPASVQDQALGPARAQLFRDGLSVNRFVKDGKLITIDALDGL